MSDLITFQLSQLARALGPVPLPREEDGVQHRPDQLRHYILYQIMEKWRSLPLTWYWKAAWKNYLI
jgi:hypothetical protein